MKSNMGLKILSVILFTIFFTTTVSAQKNVDKQRTSKPIVNAQKTSHIKKIIQKPDTIQMTANAIGNAIRGEILDRYKKDIMLHMNIEISQVHQLIINLSHEQNGRAISGTSDSLTVKGKAVIGPIGDISFIIPQDLSKSGVAIESGEFFCKGHFSFKDNSFKDIPLYFESGTVIFTDNEKSGTFSEGSIFFYNSLSFRYTNSKWIKNWF